jgi:hypothetical protein
MSGRYLIEMADVLSAAGLDVLEVDGWETRARKSGGYATGRPWCVMWHHTASNATPASDISYIINADTAPISNLYLDRTGTIHVIAAGATNTNGKGGPQKFSRGTVPLDCMNEYAVSIEAANTGVGEPWPQVQIDAFFAASIALTNWLGLEPTDISSHAGWTTRKIDPATAAAVQGPWRPASVNTSGTWSLDDLRHEAARRAAKTPAPHPPPSSEDHMYLATLADGTVVVVGSAVRPVSGDEIGPGGPFANLPRYVPNPSSYWHQWLKGGVAEYSRRVQPVA